MRLSLLSNRLESNWLVSKQSQPVGYATRLPNRPSDELVRQQRLVDSKGVQPVRVLWLEERLVRRPTGAPVKVSNRSVVWEASNRFKPSGRRVGWSATQPVRTQSVPTGWTPTGLVSRGRRSTVHGFLIFLSTKLGHRFNWVMNINFKPTKPLYSRRSIWFLTTWNHMFYIRETLIDSKQGFIKSRHESIQSTEIDQG